jgi:hypothetical protein
MKLKQSTHDGRPSVNFLVALGSLLVFFGLGTVLPTYSLFEQRGLSTEDIPYSLNLAQVGSLGSIAEYGTSRK